MIYEKCIVMPKIIDTESTSVLQALEIYQACLNNLYHMSLIFMDSYYTRHTLAEVIKSMIDNCCKITSMIKMNFIDSTNKPNLKKVI